MFSRLSFSFVVIMLISPFLHAQEVTIDYFQANPNESILKISKISINGANKSLFKLTSVADNTKEIYFPANEFFTTKTKNLLFTKAYEEDKDGLEKSVLKSYTISNNSLLKRHELILREPYLGIFPLFSIDGVMITDEFEALGQEIMIFDKNLSKKLSYSPYGDNGFEYSIFDLKDENAAFLFFPVNNDDATKFVFINAKTGNLLTVRDINFPKHSISDLKIIGEFILVKRYEGINYTQMLTCFDISGNIIWTKVLENDFILDIKIGGKTYAYIINSTSAYLIDISSGDILVEKDFNHLLNISGNEQLKVLEAVTDELNENIYLSVRILDSMNLGNQKHKIVKLTSDLYKFSVLFDKLLPLDNTLRLSLNGSNLLIHNSDNKLLFQHEK